MLAIVLASASPEILVLFCVGVVVAVAFTQVLGRKMIADLTSESIEFWEVALSQDADQIIRCAEEDLKWRLAQYGVANATIIKILRIRGPSLRVTLSVPGPYRRKILSKKYDLHKDEWQDLRGGCEDKASWGMPD